MAKDKSVSSDEEYTGEKKAPPKPKQKGVSGYLKPKRKVTKALDEVFDYKK